jgi:signal transduction histidine kinase
MKFRSLYLLLCGSGIAAIAALLILVSVFGPPGTTCKHPVLLAVLLGAFAALALTAAFITASDIHNFLQRITSILKEKTKGEVNEPTSMNLPIRFNEIGCVAVSINQFNRKFREETRRNDEAQNQLSRTDEEKAHFLAMISHELRTPLNTILGFSQILLDGVEGELSDSQNENIKIIKHSGHNLLSLINDILDLSELESGRLQIHRQKVDLVPLIRTTVKEVSGQIKGKRTTITSGVPDGAISVYADPKRVYQVLMNLLGNAVKFTPKGEIIVDAEREEGFVRVQVRDAGYGISPQDLPFIFLEFRQAGSLRSRRKGAGLGLAICKRLVEVQGGVIDCESTPGKGSTFSFTLPLYTDQEERGVA